MTMDSGIYDADKMGHCYHFIRDLLKPPPDIKQGCCSHPVKIVINGASSNVKPMIREVVFFWGFFYNIFLRFFKGYRKQNNSIWFRGVYSSLFRYNHTDKILQFLADFIKN